MTKAVVFMLGFLVALLGAGCSTDGAASDSTTASEDPASPTDASNVCERLSGMGGTGDYRPATSPRDLSERSELVVEGTISEVVSGRTFRPDEVVPAKSVVMVVNVVETHKGFLPPASRGRVHIESQPHLNRPASHFDRLLPRDSAVLVYLNARVPPGGELPPVDNPSAGRPLGQPLWQLSNPQGLLIEFGAEGVVQVPECKRYPESELADFHPDRQEFPTGDHAP